MKAKCGPSSTEACAKSVPDPTSSRTAPTRTSASVKPTPMVSPSKAEARMPWREAKASARPRMAQFVTISAMKRPRTLCRSWTQAFSARSTTVTMAAITRTKAGMRISGVMARRRAEMAAFDRMRTAVVASPIPSPLVAVPVMASVGQSASIWPTTMFLSQSPSRAILPKSVDMGASSLRSGGGSGASSSAR